MTNKFSIVIPCYRSTMSLEDLVCNCFELYEQNIDEIILVFDAGNDNTWTTITNLVNKYEKVIGLKLSRNYGQHNATIAGFSHVKSEFIVTMDEDLQHNPVFIEKLFVKQNENSFDVVYGVYEEKNHNWFRNTTSRILNKLLWIGIPELHQDYSSFRLIKSKVAKNTCEMNNSYTFLDGYLTWLTTNVSSVKVKHYESMSGPSSYTLKKLLEHSVNIFITFSRLPIKLLTYSAFIFFILSISYSIFIVISALIIENYAAGFPTLVAILGFGFGFVLLGMGILGEYIQRINLKTTKRPNYIISEIIK